MSKKKSYNLRPDKIKGNKLYNRKKIKPIRRRKS